MKNFLDFLKMHFQRFFKFNEQSQWSQYQLLDLIKLERNIKYILRALKSF